MALIGLVLLCAACPGPSEPEGPGPAVQLDEVAAITNRPTIDISGSTEEDARIEVSGGAEPAEATADSIGEFTVRVPLAPNETNRLSVVAINRAGARGPAATATVVHDDIAPEPPTFTTPEFTADDPFTVTGTTEPGATVRVDAPRFQEGPADDSGEFAVPISLTPNAPNLIIARAIDLAGNVGAPESTTVIHDGLPPTFNIVSPGPGDTTPAPPASFEIRARYGDGDAGIDTATFDLTADRRIIGLLLQDGTEIEDIPAGASLGEFFSVTDTAAFVDFDGTRYAFPEGTNTLSGTVADLVGNISSPDSVSFNATPPANNLMVILSEADIGTSPHVVPVGLINLEDLGGINFRLNFDPAVLVVDSIRTTGRVTFPASSNVETEGEFGSVTVVLFDVDGDPIPGGAGIILDFYVSVSPQAVLGDSPITVTDLAASDPRGNSVTLVGTDGFVTIR